jgi:hypothetical protein
MLKLLKICLINPGTDLVMCTSKRKNVNYTDEPRQMTCERCLSNYILNVKWWADKVQRCITYEPNVFDSAVPVSRYEAAWISYVDAREVRRADAYVICEICNQPYRSHLQPLKELNPTIRILCKGEVVKL